MTVLWSAALLATLLGSTVAAPAPDLPTSFDLKEVDAYIAGQVKAKGYVGLSVAVMRDGKIVYAKGHGRRQSAGAFFLQRRGRVPRTARRTPQALLPRRGLINQPR